MKKKIENSIVVIPLVKEQPTAIEQAAEKYFPIWNETLKNGTIIDSNESLRNLWIAGATSPEAKLYWYEYFKNKNY